MVPTVCKSTGKYEPFATDGLPVVHVHKFYNKSLPSAISPWKEVTLMCNLEKGNCVEIWPPNVGWWLAVALLAT